MSDHDAKMQKIVFGVVITFFCVITVLILLAMFIPNFGNLTDAQLWTLAGVFVVEIGVAFFAAYRKLMGTGDRSRRIRLMLADEEDTADLPDIRSLIGKDAVWEVQDADNKSLGKGKTRILDDHGPYFSILMVADVEYVVIEVDLVDSIVTGSFDTSSYTVRLM